MAKKPNIPDFPTLPDFGLMITQACEVVASVRGIPYDFNGTLSLENKFVVLFKTVKEMFDAQYELVNSYKALYNFINQYFSNLDVQNEVNEKIQSMASDGTLLTLLVPTISIKTSEWLQTNITNPANPPIDTSLKVENAAADAKITGLNRPLNVRELYDNLGLTINTENGFTPAITLGKNSTCAYLDYQGKYSMIPTDDTYKRVFETYKNPTAGYYGVYVKENKTNNTFVFYIRKYSDIATTKPEGEVLMWFFYDGKKVDVKWTAPFTNIQNGTTKPWVGKEWYAYGTSITNIAKEGRYATYLANLSGLKLTNKGISGGGIVNNTKIKDAIMNITDGKLNADLITIEVGENDNTAVVGDIYDTGDNTFCGALNQCLRYLQQHVPNAQIVVWASPTTIESTPNSGIYIYPDHKYGTDNHTQYEQRTSVRKVCELNNVKYIDMYESCGLGFYRQYYNRNLTQDGVHPSNIGGKNIAEYIWSQLKNMPLWYTSAN